MGERIKGLTAKVLFGKEAAKEYQRGQYLEWKLHLANLRRDPPLPPVIVEKIIRERVSARFPDYPAQDAAARAVGLRGPKS